MIVAKKGEAFLLVVEDSDWFQKRQVQQISSIDAANSRSHGTGSKMESFVAWNF
jgi:hypothetical protein